jgi:hypothetical protein
MDRSLAQLPNIRLLTRAALFDACGSVLVVAAGRAVPFVAALSLYWLNQMFSRAVVDWRAYLR